MDKNKQSEKEAKLRNKHNEMETKKENKDVEKEQKLKNANDGDFATLGKYRYNGEETLPFNQNYTSMLHYKIQNLSI